MRRKKNLTDLLTSYFACIYKLLSRQMNLVSPLSPSNLLLLLQPFFKMESNAMLVLFVVVLMISLATSTGYPPRYSRPQKYSSYYKPKMASAAQARSFSGDYYYQDPYEVSQLNELLSSLILGQLYKTIGNQQQKVQMRMNENSNSLISRADSIPGAFLVPAKVNGAFAGPLAVVPAHYKGPGAVTNSAATGAQYLAIIDGPNWPFIGRPKISSFDVKPQYSIGAGAQYVRVPNGPNWPYIGVASQTLESRSLRPMDYSQHLIDDDSYIPMNYYSNDAYLYRN